jgi:hypothetical protein
VTGVGRLARPLPGLEHRSGQPLARARDLLSTVIERQPPTAKPTMLPESMSRPRGQPARHRRPPWPEARRAAGRSTTARRSLRSDLRGATIKFMILTSADLRRADLRGADLSNVELPQGGASSPVLYTPSRIDTVNFRGALADGSTRWPYGFDFVAAGVKMT